MNTYLIDPRNNGGDQFTIEASDIGEAAKLAARKIFPRLAAHIAVPDARYFTQRETGDSQGSGLFKLWKSLKGEGHQQSDHGSCFHVMEL